MATAIISPRGSPSPGAERSPRFTNAAIAGSRVSSAKHHSISMSETFARRTSNASGQYIPGAYPESNKAPPPVKVGASEHEQVTHAGHDHRPTLKVDLPTHEEPTGAREGVGSLPGPNTAQGVAILPDEKEHLHDEPHPPHKKHPQKGRKHKEHKEPGPQAELPTSEPPTGSRVGIGSMPGSNRESGVATLPEERIEGRPYGQGHTGFEELGGGKQAQPPPGEMDSHLATQVERAGGKIAETQARHQGETKDVPIVEKPQEIEEVPEVPEFLEGEFERTAAGKYEVVFKPALPPPGEAATSKEPTGTWTTVPSVARVPATSIGPQPPEEAAEMPQFLEGGYGTTVAGGKYEAVYEPLLPGPGEAATSKEPSKPSAPFAQSTVFLKSHAEPEAPAEVAGAPSFIEGGFESTVAGGKYEAEFKPALPGPGQAATSKEPSKPGAPFAQPTVTLKPHAPEEVTEVPHFIEGGFENTVAGGKYEVEFKPALPGPGEAATSKEPTKPSVPFAQPTVSLKPRATPEEAAEMPQFIEGGYGTTVAGGKYEAVYEPLLPGPGEAATSKEPSKPGAPFAQPTVTLKPHAPEEVMEVPHFIEGGFESTVAGGKYEVEFKPALPGPGEAATSKEPTKPSAPFAQPTVSHKPRAMPEEAAEMPQFLEGGYGTTVAGGKYEAVYEPLLPGPGEAATSKEPAKPGAPFAQPTVSLKPHAPEEVTEVPHFIEGGFESTVAGGKYEVEFKPALPGPGEAATSKEPTKPSAPFAQPTVSLKPRAEPQAPEEIMGAPDFIEGGFGSTVAGGKYEAEFKPALPSPGEAATSKEPMKPSVPFSQPTVTLKPHAPEEVMGVPDFIEGGFESTVAGGKYEAEFKPALPGPGEAATSKEPAKPSAPFAQTTMLRQPVSAEHQAAEEPSEVPHFIEGGFESTTAGGKYEAVFEPTLPPTGGATMAQPAPGLPPYLGKPISKEEEAVQVEQARRFASRKAAGIN